ncbi:hypothetical protein [Desulfonauticus submarinus]
MNILKKILKHEVFPALGCTEPIAISYAARTASSYTFTELKSIKITNEVMRKIMTNKTESLCL